MQIHINDEFDLKKIVYSGQCFRPKELSENTYRFISAGNVLVIKDLGNGDFDLSCDKKTYDNFWHHYFDLDRNYSEIRAEIPKDDDFLTHAGELGRGIRILNQDPFEMLISFIISQRKSIPAIRSSVEKICETYGSVFNTETFGSPSTDTSSIGTDANSPATDNIHLFPTAAQIMEKGLDGLSGASLGYRLPYICGVVEDIYSGKLDLKKAAALSDDELLSYLMEIKGVGIKVASCVALFAYGRSAIAPVDTWINKVIDTYYGGVSPYPAYGERSGIYQQYAFFAMIAKD